MVSDERDSSSVDSDLSEHSSEAVPSETHQSIGAYLTRQRRLRGISREELCQLTRIPARSLARLEEGAFDEVDDGFVRGFVRTVADALGLDPDDTVSRMCDEPTAADSVSSVSISTFGHLGAIFAGLLLVLVSAGLVSVAAQYLPGQPDSAVTIVRRDPVRVLAESDGASGFSGVRAIVHAEAPSDLPSTVSGVARSVPGTPLTARVGTATAAVER